ncbi:hypothetical protein BJ741DRAFT_711698, partial [Chytriomyces cf. hyalinus JEL632]
ENKILFVKNGTCDEGESGESVIAFYALPSRILYTKQIKIWKVAGNKDIAAGESGIPVNVFDTECTPDECSLTPNLNEDGVLVSFDLTETEDCREESG